VRGWGERTAVRGATTGGPFAAAVGRVRRQGTVAAAVGRMPRQGAGVAAVGRVPQQEPLGPLAVAPQARGA
uniref:hypothetical protein n=1 Tax=Streptomyces sp. NRRL S-1448 TaxID=1463883 RepID=UPI001F1FDC3A